MLTGVIDNNIIEKANIRFATTAIANKYRKYAAKGELLMDKVSGEHFIRRTDGKIVSFNQTHKYAHDELLELRVLFVNNESFTYPTDTDNFLYIANYDLQTIQDNDESKINILKNDCAFTDVSINLSQTNGFFIKLMSRDCDKGIIEFLTNRYNTLKSYTGTNSKLKSEATKFTNDDTWFDSNATINFTLGANSYSANMRINELNYVSIGSTVSSGTVTINSISYDKLQFAYENASLISTITNTAVNDTYANYPFSTYDPGVAEVSLMNLQYFTSLSSLTGKLLTTGEIPIDLFDGLFMSRYMGKMEKLMNSSDFIISPTEPNATEWTANTVWAEQLTNITDTGSETTDAVFDIDAFEDYLAVNG